MSDSATSSLAGSLPRPRTRLIGRDAERALAQDLLLEQAVPLLTLTGPGGVGKTRLALAIAADARSAFADGVFWVDLAPLVDPALVPATMVTALGLIPAADRPPVDVLVHHLHLRQTLLILDNCEHFLEAAAALVSTLLDRCPAMQVLATSRAPLRVHGEHRLPVDPLPLPEADVQSLATLHENEAVRLFVERARAVRPTTHLTTDSAPIIADICRRLDGLPLAIELAAARVSVLSLEALLAQVTDRLRLLGPGPRDHLPRQQTIEATIAWSYHLLNADSQQRFRRLAVFTGGFALEAAQVIGGPEAAGSTSDEVQTRLATLLDQSLVRRMDAEREPRFTMLETIRAFGLAQLAASGEEDEVRARHLTFMLTVAQRGKASLWTAQQATWLDQIQVEHSNFRAALTWALDNGQGDVALELAAALGPFWRLRGYLQEGLDWLERAITAGGSVPTRLDAAFRAINIAVQLGRGHTHRKWADFALQLANAAGTPIEVATAQRWVGSAHTEAGDLDQASILYGLALQTFQQLGDQVGLASTLADLSDLAHRRGETTIACDLIEQALPAAHAAGDLHVVARCLCNLGYLAEAEGDSDRAVQCFEDATALYRQMGNTNDVRAVAQTLGMLYIAQEDWARADAVLSEALELQRQIGDTFDIAQWLNNLGEVARLQGAWDRATALYTEAYKVARHEDDLLTRAVILENLGNAALQQRDYATAQSQLQDALRQYRSVTDWMGMSTCLVQLASIALATGHPSTALQLMAAGRHVQEANAVDLPADVLAIAQHVENALHQTFGEHRFAELRAQSRERSLDEVITEALTLSPVALGGSLRSQAEASSLPSQFTQRELEVLTLLAKRLTNKEIAEALFVSPRTVQSHTISIFSKLGVDNRRDAAALAVQLGLA